MKRVFAISLAFFTLLGSVHMKVASHYCGGTLAKQSLTWDREETGCEMPAMGEKLTQVLPPNETVRISQIPCCDDTYEVIELHDCTRGASAVGHLVFFISTVSGEIFSRKTVVVERGKRAQFAFFSSSPPPLGVRLALLQSFLI